MPQAGRSLADSVVDALAPMRLLLLLDNCEHLLPAVTVLAERIVTGCPGVRVLATSRERIDAEGEVVHPLEPLVVPAADADPARAWAEPPEALQLLRDRLLSVRPGFVGGSAERAALVEVCRQLDGLPLAIELAAARMSGMSVLDVAERLERRLTVLTRGRRTAPTRHRTLRAAIGWSYDLLDEPQRRVFERASVFSGGFTLVAAGQVCGGHRLGAEETADVVGSLVDKSLLVLDGSRGAGRYDMLETLREFAHERLEVRGEAELIARAHAEFFTALAERADVLVRGPDERAGVALFRDEMTNLRAAHAWARRAGRADLACALSAAVGWYAFFRMQTDLLAWAEHVPDAAGPRYAEALATAGRGAWMRGDLADAQFLADRSLAAARDDPSARCGWHLQANVALFRGDLPRAADCYDRATRLAEQSADGYHLALLLGCRALVSCYVGDAAAAATVAAAAATAAARCGTPSALAWTEYVQGEVLAAADPARAVTHLQRADAVAATVDAEFVRGVAGLTAASLHARHGEPTAAALAVAQLIDRWLRGGNHRQLWTTLREAAELLVRVDRPLAAATVLGAIEHADADNLWGADADRLDRLHQRLRDQLGTDLARPWSRGADLDLPALADLVRGQLHEASRTGGASDGSATANLLQPRVPTLPARADRPAQHR
jgi:predicted ATPase